MAISTSAYSCIFFFFIVLLAVPSQVVAASDYADALRKSLLFLEAQRSGKLPGNQRVWWRGDSGLSDGKSEGVDLQGGYYDAGDHVKYGFPMAFSMTMLAWGIVQYKQALSATGQLGYALDALRWGTDYFIKAHPEPNVLWAEVGDGDTDHNCWQRAEDMTTSRQAYRLDTSHPGSDQAGETAAAMAAASLAFKKLNPTYSATLVQHARQLFTFADTYRGKYDDSIYNTKAYYQSVSGYNDELLWAAIWLYQATGEQSYLDYVVNNAYSMGGSGWNIKELSWDVKYAGVQILVSKILLEGKGYGSNAGVLQQYQRGAEFYLCSLLRKNTDGNNAQLTPGGLLFTRPWNNMQYVTSAAFSLGVYSDYLSAAGKQLQCASGSVAPSELLSLAQSQVDYILGKNPKGMSYMVGYGANYPKHVHHRGASIVSYKTNPTFVTCKGGYDTWYASAAADPNVVVGAVVGGPDAGDQYYDDRKKYEQAEPTISANAPLVGILARLARAPQQPAAPAPRRPRYTPPTPKRVPARRKRVPSPARPLTPITKKSYKPPAQYIRKRPAVRRSAPLGTSSLRSAPYNAGKASTNVAFQQMLTSTWTQNNKVYHRYSVKVTNISKGKLSNLKLSSQGLAGAVYGISKLSATSNLYTLPPWFQSLSPGQSASFVYIQPGPQATFRLASFTTPTF